ncbi:FMRFamide receptor-like Protein [Elysia marginata]|uniref:FMRFamide receptor-like Protein n=1 Tax=Elysia marginata TaxID=1093978 RepID=A0AAV4JQS3_9GAST|nr:FMRFamide receptor-like Protein [Elysia marginata]
MDLTNYTDKDSHTHRVFPDAGPLVDRIHWIVVFVAMPTLCILGVAGNSISLVVLYKQGFKKSTNILLFALAISDILFMIGAQGPAKLMYEWGRGGLWFPEREARVLYYFYHVFDYINWTAGPMSMGLPILITAERFVAVFFPLKFHTIVTRRRTLVSVIVLIVFTYLPQIYIRFWFRFDYVWDPKYNASVGLSVRTDLYYDQQYLSWLLGHFYAAIGYFVIIVGTGTLAIGIRISLAAAQRKRMMAGKAMKGEPGGAASSHANVTHGNIRAPSRTTKTLLALCVFYTISCLFVAMPTFFPEISVWPLFTLNPNFRSMEVFMYQLAKLDLCVNASCNFVIYVAMNKNFRQTFFDIFKRKKSHS